MVSDKKYNELLRKNIELESELLELNRRLDKISDRYQEIHIIASRLEERLENAKKIFRERGIKSENEC